MADNYFARKRREREAQRVQVTGGDPKLQPEVRKLENQADASRYDPAKAAADVRNTDAQTRQIEALTPIKVRAGNAAADRIQREAERGSWGDVDKEFAKEFVTWRAAGGYADVRKQLEQLGVAKQALEGGKQNLTGPVVGRVPDFIGAFTNPAAIDTRESVEEVVQRALRLILGAQFTEKEGERLIARAYNPALDEATNAKRVGRLVTQLGAMAEAKEAAANYFEQNGTLKGFEGPSFSASSADDFNLDEDDKPSATFGADGNADYSEMQGGGKPTPVDPGASYRTEPDAEANAFIDRLVRGGTPYTQAVRQFRKLYPQAQVFTPKDYNDALKHQKANPSFRGSYGGAVRSTPLSETEQRNNALTQTPLGAYVGSTANAALGGLPAYAAGDQGRFWQETVRQQNPGAAFAGDVTGAVAGTLGASRLLRPLFPAAPSGTGLIPRTLANPGTRHIVGDTAYGGLYGATQNPGNELGGALGGAAASVAGNAVGRYALAPALRLGGDMASKASQQMFGRSLVPQPLTGGQNLIAGQARGSFDEITGQLDEAARLNLPLAAADTHPALRAMAGSAVRKSPDVRALAERTLDPRQLGQAERAIGAIDRHLAPHGNVDAIAQEATARARAASGDIYRDAFAQPAPDLTRNPALKGILERPTAEAGLRRAYNLALDEGANPAELSIKIGVDGKPILNANPTWKTLHYVRRGLDAEIDGAIDPVTRSVKPGMSDAQGAMIRLRKELDRQIGDLNPTFKAADAEYAKYVQQGSAARQGYGATNAGVRPDNLEIALSGQSPDTLPFFQRGYASSLADTVERTRLSSNPLKTIYGSPAQQQKLGAVFPDGAQPFSRINDLEAQMGKTHVEALGGSQTAPRIEADKLFEGQGGLAGDLAFAAATGAPPPSLVQRGVRGLGDAWKMGVGQRRANEVGPILLNTDPQATAAMLRQMFEAAAARRAYEQQMRAVGGSMLAAPFIVGGQ